MVGSAESGHIVVRPDDPDVIIAGAVGSAPGGGGILLRYDHRSGQSRIITVWPEDQANAPAKEAKYRFQFHFPTVLSPHDPNVLYVAANIVFRSTNEGTSWEPISPDLTRQDPAAMEEVAGGPVTSQGVTAVFNTGSVMTFAESPLVPGVFWAGSDDGLVHLSRDGGQTWQNVTPPDLEAWTHVGTVEPSPHDAGTVYVAADRFRLDVWRPYLYKTHDYGRTWTAITEGIPSSDFTRVIREDPVRRGLLYAGTERGVYVSFTGGARWQPLQLNLPVVPVYDLLVKDDDLIAATHGRAFWILDDVTPLRQMAEGVRLADAHVFAPRAAYRPFPKMWEFPSRPGTNYEWVGGSVMAYREVLTPTGERKRVYLDAGANPPRGAVVHYCLRDACAGRLTLTFRDARGEEIRMFESGEDGIPPRVPAAAGANRFVWDLRYPGANGEVTMPGPVAVPGRYTVELRLDGHTRATTIQVLEDPRVAADQDDLEAQFGLLIQIRDKAREVNVAVADIRWLRSQVTAWESRARSRPRAEDLLEAGRKLKAELGAVESELIAVPGPNPQKPPPTRLGPKLASLRSVVASAPSVPTRQSFEVFEHIAARIDSQLALMRKLIADDAARFEVLVRELQIPAVVV